jgi:phage-related protein
VTNAWRGSPAWKELGHELCGPEADYLRDEIYELRATYRRIQYRMLYFFHGQGLAAVSHGFVKGGPVPNEEIDRAVERKRKFARSPREHSFEGQN